MADYWYLSGLLIQGWILVGVRWKPNYSATDACWPGRGGERGIVLFGWLWGWWNDPGY